MSLDSKSVKLYKSLIIALSIMLIFVSSIMFTGSYFTHSTSIIGDLESPDFELDLNYDGSDVTQLTDSIYITNSTWPSTVNKTLSVTIGSNVEQNVVRVMINFEWGLGTGDNFATDPDYSLPNATSVNYNSSNWVGGIEASDAQLYEYPTYYYYNGIVSDKDQIVVFNSLSFNATGEDASYYNAHTLKISIYMEIAPASDNTLDEIWGAESFSGPTSQWVSSIKSMV